MKTHLITLFFLLLTTTLTAQSIAEIKLDQALARARADLSQVKEKSHQEAKERANQRRQMVGMLLELEKEERRLTTELTLQRQARTQITKENEALEKSAAMLSKAASQLTLNITRGAKEILGRTAGSLAGLGNTQFRKSREHLEQLLQTGNNTATNHLLAAAAETAMLEIEVGSKAQLIMAELPGQDGKMIKAKLIRVGLLGAAGPQGIVIPDGVDGCFRLHRPQGFCTGNQLRDELDQLDQLPETGGPAAVPLDVTGGLAGAALGGEKTLAETLAGGGLVMYPIGMIAFIGLTLALWRGIMLAREKRILGRLTQQLPQLAINGAHAEAINLCNQLGGAAGRTLAACCSSLNLPELQAERVLDQALQKGALGLQRFLATIAVIGTLAPFLGLLGTVTGMIRTFSALTLVENTDSSLLAGGIAEALITTECGLITAIPLVLLHSLLAGRSERIEADLEETATTLLLRQTEDKP